MSPMLSPDDYRKFADQCIAMAERAAPDARETLLRMADAWLQLALVDIKNAQRNRPDIEPAQNAPSTNKMQ
jgi:hypothetical protein